MRECTPGYPEFVFHQFRRERLISFGNMTFVQYLIFTGESNISLQTAEKCVRVWRKEDTSNWLQKHYENQAFRGRSTMVWAVISSGFTTNLHIFKRGVVTALWYQNEALVTLHSVTLHSAAIVVNKNILPSLVLTNDNSRSVELRLPTNTSIVTG